MKVCPKCNQTYTDDGLNFCLSDGELLMEYGEDNPTQLFNDQSPPTVFLDQSRTTNPNHSAWQTASPPQPLSPWQGQPQHLQNQPYGGMMQNISRDQTLPIISIVTGVLSLLMVCFCGGIWLGVPAAITGYLGMRNADSDPAKYTGRGLAIGGMVLGIISFLCSLVFIIFQILAS